MSGRIIETEACIAEGLVWLTRAEPRFARALELTGPPPPRRRPDGFAALVEAIVSQQLSVASANAIVLRMRAEGLVEEGAILRADEAALRACGLSGPKIRYLRALAAAGLDYHRLRTAPDEEVIATLTEITGIGRWTAEIYAMFSLGRADVFAAGDLALQEAARLLFELQARPAERRLRAMAAPWSPWRGVAARLLWAYYRARKQREGIR